MHVAVLNNANLDIIYRISEKNLRFVNKKFSEICKCSTVKKLIQKCSEIALTTGGEVRIDKYRNYIEDYMNCLKSYSVNEKYILGGNAANTSVALANKGLQTYLVTTLRTDTYGKWIKNVLLKENVKLDYVRYKSGRKKEATTFGIEVLGKERVFFNDGCDNRYVNLNEKFIKDAKNGKFDCILLLGLHHVTHELKKLTHIIQYLDSRIISDSGDMRYYTFRATQQLTKIYKHCQVVFFNEIEIFQFLEKLGLHATNLKSSMLLLHKLLNTTIGVHTKQYSICYANKIFTKITTNPLKNIKINTGLGDYFIAGFVEAYLKNKCLGECLKEGNELARMRAKGY